MGCDCRFLGRVYVIHHESGGGLVVCHQRRHTQAGGAFGDGLVVWSCVGNAGGSGGRGFGLGRASTGFVGVNRVGRAVFGMDGLAVVSSTGGAERGQRGGQQPLAQLVLERLVHQRAQSQSIAAVHGLIAAIHRANRRLGHEHANLGAGLGAHHQLCGGVFLCRLFIASGIVGTATSGMGGGQSFGRDDDGNCAVDFVGTIHAYVMRAEHTIHNAAIVLQAAFFIALESPIVLLIQNAAIVFTAF